MSKGGKEYPDTSLLSSVALEVTDAEIAVTVPFVTRTPAQFLRAPAVMKEHSGRCFHKAPLAEFVGRRPHWRTNTICPIHFLFILICPSTKMEVRPPLVLAALFQTDFWGICLVQEIRVQGLFSAHPALSPCAFPSISPAVFIFFTVFKTLNPCSHLQILREKKEPPTNTTSSLCPQRRWLVIFNTHLRGYTVPSYTSIYKVLP